MEVNSLVQTNDIDVLAAVLTYLKKKRLNILEEILNKFDDMPDDFEKKMSSLHLKEFTKLEIMHLG